MTPGQRFAERARALLPAASHGASLLDAAAWRYFGRYLQPRAWPLAVCVLLTALQSLLILPTLMLARYALDVAVPHHDLTLLLAASAGIIGCRLLGSASSLVLRARVARLIKQTVQDIREDLLGKLYRLSREFYGRAETARLHARLVHDTERVDTMCNVLFSSVLPAAAAGLTVLGVMLFLNAWMVLLAALLAPLVWLPSARTGVAVKRDAGAFRTAFEGFSRGTYFVLRQFELTRLQACEDDELGRQRRILGALSEAGVRMSMSHAFQGQVQRTLTGAAGVILLAAGGYAVIAGAMTLGDLFTFCLAAAMINGQANTALSGVSGLLHGNESLVALRELLAEQSEEPYNGRRPPGPLGTIRLENVDFGYPDKPLLHDVSIAIAPGARIGLIGANGAGKSTLVHLVLGLVRPAAGRLLCDGVPYDEIDLRALRRQIGVVPQHPSFFAGTVRENIAYGRPEATDEQILAAASIAGADKVLERLPLGLDSPIGDGGVLLSGGEKQRLAIARALLGRPRLLVLDEPMNHLDSATVGAVDAALASTPERPAILTISHRPDALRHVELLLELRDGRLLQCPADTVLAGEGAMQN